MRKNSIINRVRSSILVATIVGLLFPVAWMISLGDTYRTQEVEGTMFDGMSQDDKSKWVAENQTKVSFFGHVVSTFGFIGTNFKMYLSACFQIFIIVFICNFIVLEVKRVFKS